MCTKQALVHRRDCFKAACACWCSHALSWVGVKNMCHKQWSSLWLDKLPDIGRWLPLQGLLARWPAA